MTVSAKCFRPKKKIVEDVRSHWKCVIYIYEFSKSDMKLYPKKLFLKYNYLVKIQNIVCDEEHND